MFDNEEKLVLLRSLLDSLIRDLDQIDFDQAEKKATMARDLSYQIEAADDLDVRCLNLNKVN